MSSSNAVRLAPSLPCAFSSRRKASCTVATAAHAVTFAAGSGNSFTVAAVIILVLATAYFTVMIAIGLLR